MIASISYSYPKTYRMLRAANKEARLNTGSTTGEYGTLDSILELSPSKQDGHIRKAVVYRVMANTGPDISWVGMAPLMRKLAKVDVVQAFEDGTLTDILEKVYPYHKRRL